MRAGGAFLSREEGESSGDQKGCQEQQWRAFHVGRFGGGMAGVPVPVSVWNRGGLAGWARPPLASMHHDPGTPSRLAGMRGVKGFRRQRRPRGVLIVSRRIIGAVPAPVCPITPSPLWLVFSRDCSLSLSSCSASGWEAYQFPGPPGRNPLRRRSRPSLRPPHPRHRRRNRRRRPRRSRRNLRSPLCREIPWSPFCHRKKRWL